MSASFQALPGDLQTAAISTSLLPIGMHTPVASIETSEAGLHGCGDCLFSLQQQSAFSFWEAVSLIKVII
jgi:hypothetical protein